MEETYGSRKGLLSDLFNCIYSSFCSFNMEKGKHDVRPNEELKLRPITSIPVNRNTPGIAVMPVEKEAVEYNFKHKNRGFAIIFNHEEFESKSLDRRRGTHLDVMRLKNTLENKLEFRVTVHPNLTKAKIFDEVNRVRKLDHSNNDCFLMVCLTHGQRGNELSAKDMFYKADELWTPFGAKSCPTLAGKPKLFFIQACRGEKFDEGTILTTTHSADSETQLTSNFMHRFDGFQEYKIPNPSDILVMNATAHGYVAWRTIDYGSPFIQSLCKQLEKNAFNEDLETILKAVIRDVSIGFESDSNNEDMDRKKCTPEISNNTLMRKIWFSPKSSDDDNCMS